MQNLRNWNIAMGVIQLGMGIFLTVIYNNEGLFKLDEPMYRIGVDKKSTATNEYSLEWVQRKTTAVPYAYEAVSFFYVTSFFHFLYVLMGSRYEDMIENENNYLRWIEYSISATLMIRIIALQCGIRDENALTSITMNTVGIMLQGQIVESILSTNSTKIGVNEKTVLLVATIVGWILMVTNFYIIIKQYINLKDDVDKFNCPDVGIPSFVLWIIVTQLLFYSTFGFIQIYQIYNRLYRPDQYDYRTIETMYIVDSLLSKVTLGAILGYSVIGASKGVYGKFACN